MLDYKTILTLRYSAGLSGSEIARRIDNASKTGVNDFLRAFERSERISFPLPEGITNYGIYRKHSNMSTKHKKSLHFCRDGMSRDHSSTFKIKPFCSCSGIPAGQQMTRGAMLL